VWVILRSVIGLAAGWLFLGAAPARPQQRLRAESNLVLVNATVRDRNGHFVSSLKAGDFRLFDGDAEQRIASFSKMDAPVSTVIVLDVSGSMRQNLSTLKSALGDLISAAGPEDEFALVLVRDAPEWVADFTRIPEELLGRIGSEQAHGSTALRDSIYLAAQGIRRGHQPRKAMLIVSDGLDNHSRYSDADLKRMLLETDATIYAAGLYRGFPEDQVELGRQLLSDIAEQSGGFYVTVNKPKDLERALRNMDVRDQYLIGFVPEGVTLDGRYHRVRLKVTPATPLRVSWRRGYYSPVASSSSH
jgi:VWFA-related protein